MRVETMTFFFIYAIILIIKTLWFKISLKEVPLKLISLKLNIRPYNKLSKEIRDFKDLGDKYIYT